MATSESETSRKKRTLFPFNPRHSYIETVIKGVIDAEDSAIAQYKKIIELSSGFDPETEDLAITALADEEEHRRDFLGFLKELEAGRLGWITPEN
jgi:ferritin-like protein